MGAMNCPNCGGPAQVPAGVATMNCTFCGTSFNVAPPAPPPSPYAAPPPAWGPPPQQSQIPQIVIVAPGESYGTPMATAVGTFVGMRLLFGLLPVAITLLVAGIIAFSSMRGMAGGGLSLGGWNGSGPLTCGGNDSYQVSGISATIAGSAINVGGNCHFTCQGCNLKASVVIAAGGNAQIDLVDTHIEGTDSAIIAGGNAQVRMTGSSTIVGRVTQGGNASVILPPGASTGAGAAAAKPPTTGPAVTSSPSHAAPSPAPSKRH
jgi:hypothetical protein